MTCTSLLRSRVTFWAVAGFLYGGSPSGYRAARMISATTKVISGGFSCAASSFQDVKASSCKQESDSFVKGKSCEPLFPVFPGLVAERGLCMAPAGNFLRFAASVTESGDDKIDVAGLGASANVSDDSKFDSSSCAVASSSTAASICVGTCEKQKDFQFFVNKGAGVCGCTLQSSRYCVACLWTMEVRVMLCVVHVLSGQVIPFNRMELKVG